MSKKNFRKRRTSSSSESEVEDIKDDSGEVIKKTKLERIEELKFIQKQRERKHGIDVYSLAIGEQDNSKNITKEQQIDNDPWKKKTGGLVDIKILKEQRGNEIVTSMASNFARETNQRDEDAEMQKFIDEQIRLKKEADKKDEIVNKDAAPLVPSSVPENKFKRPEDALFDLPKYLIENTSKHRSEESLSEQMLSGIPEVDLGVSERIRNIEDTEKAKQKLVSTRNTHTNLVQNTTSGKYKRELNPNSSDSQYAPHNTSVNFVQHKRFDDTLINPDHMVKPRINRPNTVHVEAQPVVGDAPKHELLQKTVHTQMQQSSFKKYQNTSKPINPNARRQYHVSTNMDENPQKAESETNNNVEATTSKDTSGSSTSLKPGEQAKKPQKRAGNSTEKASDDFCLERFKKNMRNNNKNSKIKIA